VVAIFTLLTVGVGSSYKLREGSKESKTLIIMMILIGLASILDPIVFLVDGSTGIIKNMNDFYIFVNHFGNGAIYLLDLCVVISWSIFLVFHLNGSVGLKRIIWYAVIFGASFIILLINIFFPFIFEVDMDGVYRRVENGAFGYVLFTVIDIIILLDSVFFFVHARIRGGILKFFPIWVFLIPVIAGIAVQGIYYGVSTINVGFSLAVCGMLMSMQNDLIFFDKLTGLYNRYYLDYLKKKMNASDRKAEYTAMMLDLNGFKQINDKYGHQEGDNALIKTGELLRVAVGSYGTVIRYAGDEFIIILHTQVDAIINEVVYNINRQFNIYNKGHVVPYELSISIGYSKADLKKYSVDDLMNDIDKKMYLDKEKRKQENKG
jgi:diguanylate cyclase (GGDEF)-like protein